MIARTKQSWQEFKESKPGHRFQDRYRRRQESEHGWTDPRRLFYVVGGLILAVGSLAFGILPGPGMLTLTSPLIHRSAWKGYSPKFRCRILHRKPP